MEPECFTCGEKDPKKFYVLPSGKFKSRTRCNLCDKYDARARKKVLKVPSASRGSFTIMEAERQQWKKYVDKQLRKYRRFVREAAYRAVIVRAREGLGHQAEVIKDRIRAARRTAVAVHLSKRTWKWYIDLRKLIGRRCRIETSDGAIRIGRISGINMHQIITNGTSRPTITLNLPIDLEIDGDSSDKIEFRRIKRIKVQYPKKIPMSEIRRNLGVDARGIYINYHAKGRGKSYKSRIIRKRTDVVREPGGGTEPDGGSDKGKNG